MKSLFIIGTDTGVGKSVVTGLLLQYLLDQGYNAAPQKWIQSGDKDTDLYVKDSMTCFLEHIAPYSFNFPASPHLSAEIEKQDIDINKIKNSFRILSEKFDGVIVEGVGGALVPFNRKELIIDIAKELNLGVLIVAQNKLGAINHTLLTIEALRKRNMDIIGIIFNSRAKEDKLIAEDNPKVIQEISGEKVIGVLPWQEDRAKLYETFKGIADKELSEWIHG